MGASDLVFGLRRDEFDIRRFQEHFSTGFGRLSAGSWCIFVSVV